MKKLSVIFSGLLLVLLPGLIRAEPLAYNTLNNNLVAFWELDEAAGGRMDSVGNNNLLDLNTVGRGPGVIGESARFVASNNECLYINSTSDLQADGDFTIAGWIKGSGADEWFVGKWGVNDEYYIRYYPADGLRFAVSTNGSDIVLVSKSVSIETWNFFVAWHDDSENKIYLQVNNDSPSNATASTVYVGTEEFTLGCYNSSGYYLDGQIDAVGFWKRTLSDTERTLLYNNGNGMEYPFIEPTPTPTSTSTPTGTRTPTSTATATSTSSGTCSDCWYTPTPTPTGYVPTGTLEIAPTPIVMSRPGNSRPTAISTVAFPGIPDPIDPDPIQIPDPISISLILIPTPTTSTLTGTGTISLTTISTTLSLSYTNPLTLSFSDGVTGSAAYTSASGILATGQGWISDAISYTNWLSGEVTTMQATSTFTIYSAPDWYAPELPRPMADIGWSFEQWYDEGDSSTRRYRLDEWGWLGGYMVSLPFQLLKTLWQLVQFLGPLGLFIAWLLIMLPIVLFFKFFNFVKNLLISLLSGLIKLVGFVRNLLPI